MPSKSGRSSEHEIAEAVVRYLQTVPHGEAPIDEIVKHLPNFIDLTDADEEASETRPNERVWEQQVRNIVSHRDSPGNFIADGILVNSPGRLALANKG